MNRGSHSFFRAWRDGRSCITTLIFLVLSVRAFAQAPTVVTETPSSADIGVSSATLRATVNTLGQSATVKFKYWADSAPGTVLETAGQAVTSNAPVPVSAHVSGLAPGAGYSYQASEDVSGSVFDGNIVTFTTQINQPPVAVDDVIFYAGAVLIDPLANDSDANGDNLLLDQALVTVPSAGLNVSTVSANRKTISYTPQFSVPAEDSLQYRVTDGFGGSAIATVRLVTFGSRAGFYAGSFQDTMSSRAGAITLTLGGGGAISVSFVSLSGDGTLLLKGAFDQSGTLARTLNVNPGDPSSATLSISIKLDPNTASISGTLEERDAAGTLTASIPQFTLLRNALPGGRPASGLRTAFLKAPLDHAGVTAEGFLVMTIGNNTRRSARFAGRMPDGEPFLAAGFGYGHTYGFSKALVRGGVMGASLHVLDLSNAGSGGIAGNLAWRKKVDPKGTYLRVGVDTDLVVAGPDYKPDEVGRPPLSLSPANATLGNARLHFSGAGVADGTRDVLINILPKAVQIVGNDTQQTGAELDPLRVLLRINALKARFSGRFLHPVTKKLVTFDGGFRAAFDGEPARGTGIFRSQGAVGTVSIEANAP